MDKCNKFIHTLQLLESKVFPPPNDTNQYHMAE